MEVPQELQAVVLEECTCSRERMWPFARQTHAWLKEQDEPTAYIKIKEEFRSPAIKLAASEGRNQQTRGHPEAVPALVSRRGQSEVYSDWR